MPRSPFLPYPRESKIVFSLALKGEGALLEPFRQSLHQMWLGSQFHHIRLQLCHAQSCTVPVDIGLSVLRVDEHARVNAMYALDRPPHRPKRAFRSVGNCHSHSKALFVSLRCGREIEIISSVFLHAVRGPHRVTAVLHPWHLVLRHDDTMVFPICKIAGGENMIVGHTEPVLQFLYRAWNVMGRVQIHLPVKHTCRRVGGVLSADNRILCRRPSTGQRHQHQASQCFHIAQVYIKCICYRWVP